MYHFNNDYFNDYFQIIIICFEIYSNGDQQKYLFYFIYIFDSGMFSPQ